MQCKEKRHDFFVTLLILFTLVRKMLDSKYHLLASMESTIGVQKVSLSQESMEILVVQGEFFLTGSALKVQSIKYGKSQKNMTKALPKKVKV